LAQSDGRIDRCGASRGNQSRVERDKNQKERRRKNGWPIGCGDSVQPGGNDRRSRKGDREPQRRPAVTRPKLSQRTILKTRPGVAPSARRRPISAVLTAVAHELKPYTRRQAKIMATMAKKPARNESTPVVREQIVERFVDGFKIDDGQCGIDRTQLFTNRILQVRRITRCVNYKAQSRYTGVSMIRDVGDTSTRSRCSPRQHP